ncbi:coiled-coil domain-containing protein, putative [Pediculus humanus corporis]|uniref:Coiled-coil domain-containing protein, putative n=1 Tax=Pediculus humanus subsp. corporis TaxID=121224 RepID=E0VM05_PEDHC|nr:coiled-coil domain-containing protein, putative [Pediculus humanus corporis]EEB14411.1 coiled-coil domain-containing protein, putative [Pediculus humanus corporis]
MKNRKNSVKSLLSLNPSTFLDSNWSDSPRLSQQLLAYYKSKSLKLEKDYDDLLKIIQEVKQVCDLTNELQLELNLRTEEVSKLQQLIGDLQVQLFREREENIRISAENDNLKIQNFENQKKINMLMMINGITDKKYYHFMTNDFQDKLVSSKLPPKLQKLKEERYKNLIEALDNQNKTSGTGDSQLSALNNESQEFYLNNHVKILKEEVEVLLKEKDLLNEERKIERQRLQKELDLLGSKFKESQDLLCTTTEKLVYLKKKNEKNESVWMEEKNKCLKIIHSLKLRLGDEITDIWSSENSHTRQNSNEGLKEKQIEKKLAEQYQQKIVALESEVNSLRERANTCRQIFRDKTEKMTAQVAYLKNKYDDLDRRRLLEAEGFRTDIKMLNKRLQELEKKLVKSATEIQKNEQQQLLVSARNTLYRAKQLEKELESVKTKLYSLESNPEQNLYY